MGSRSKRMKMKMAMSKEEYEAMKPFKDLARSVRMTGQSLWGKNGKGAHEWKDVLTNSLGPSRLAAAGHLRKQPLQLVRQLQRARVVRADEEVVRAPLARGRQRRAG